MRRIRIRNLLQDGARIETTGQSSKLENSAASAESRHRLVQTGSLRTILFASLPVLFLGQIGLWISFFPGALRGNADFRHLYVAGYMVRTGHGHDLHNYQAEKAFQAQLVTAAEPTLPFIRPAYQALLFVPFSYLSYRSAYLLFLVFNLFLLGLCSLLTRTLLLELCTSQPWFQLWLPPVMILAFTPAAVALLQGQDSLILLTLLICAATLQTRGHDFGAGACLALALFKLQIVIPILLLFVLWRLWRFVAGFAVVASALSLLSVYLVGLEQTRTFLHSLWSVGGSGGQPAYIEFPLRITLMANLRGLLFGIAGSRLSPSATTLLTLLLSAAILVAVFVLRKPVRPQNSAQNLAVATVASVAMSYYLFVHDLSVLLLPIFCVLNCAGTPNTEQKRPRLEAWLALLVFLAPLLVFITPAHFYLASVPTLALLGAMLLNPNRKGLLSPQFSA